MSIQTLVVDSSVIVKWLNQDNEGYLIQADKILSEAQNGKTFLIAPELAKYEIGNVLLFSKHLNPDQARTVLVQFYGLPPLLFIPESENLANGAFELAFDLGITYYDASFLALAKQENATLITDNPKHQGRSAEIKVISLKDY